MFSAFDYIYPRCVYCGHRKDVMTFPCCIIGHRILKSFFYCIAASGIDIFHNVIISILYQKIIFFTDKKLDFIY